MTPQLEAVLDWFKDCIVCQETLDNIRKELAPMGLTARFDGDIIVISALPRLSKPKPSTKPTRRDLPKYRHREQPAA